MPGDTSRFTHDPKKRFVEVLAQQGRVDLDSDRNELVEILTRSDRLRSFDVFGKAVVPKETTPDAFKITPIPNDLGIGVGRMYVDGLLIENFDEDQSTYHHQPFYPDPPKLNTFNGQVLAYVDVWDREITYIEDPSLLDSALGGIDTATRVQTVWQVKLAKNLNCDSDLDQQFPPTNARLTVKVTPPNVPPDPCLVPQGGGFTDIENRHYRVEIHKRKAPEPNPGTYIKFQRDPIVIEIEKIDSGDATKTVFKVKSVGRDSVLRMSKGNCVEFLNEYRVLQNEPGTIASVTDVVDGALLVTIDKQIAPADVAADLRPRLIVWHQQGVAPELLLPLDTVNDIPLEFGISVEIKGTDFHHGDYWMFPARAATHTAGPLVKAPPRGIIHHYAALATITNVNTASQKVRDCRVLWPPECDCECAACVNPEDHQSGHFTIQMAIDKVNKEGGGKVCLRPGYYLVETPLQMIEADFVWLVGHGLAVIEYKGSEPYALLIERANDAVVEGLTIIRPGSNGDRDCAAILIRDCILDVIVRNCTLELRPVLTQGIGVALEGFVLDVKIVDCLILAGTGVGSLNVGGRDSALIIAVLIEIADNIIFTGGPGVSILASGVAVTVRDNWIISFNDAGILLEGTTDPGLANLIENNRISSALSGIRTSSDRTSIVGNSVRGRFVVNRNDAKHADADETRSGIAIWAEDDESGTIESCQILTNRIREVEGCGILVDGRADGCMIKQNFILETAGGGIVVTDKGKKSLLSIENNDLRDVALGEDKIRTLSLGIRLAPTCSGAIVENTIDGVGLPPLPLKRDPFTAGGIVVDVPEVVRVHGNRIARVGGAQFPSAGILVNPPVGSIEVTNNIVHVNGAGDAVALRHCHALRIQHINLTVVGTEFGLNWQAFTLVDSPVLAGRAAHVLIWIDTFPWISFIPGRNACNVRTNELRVDGNVERDRGVVVISDRSLHVTFGGNICDGSSMILGVRLEASTIVADSNQILVGEDPTMIVDTQSGPNVPPRWTVLGNIVLNSIQLKPPDPAHDWLGFNRTL